MSIVERKSLSRLSTGALIYILSLPQSVSHITTLPSNLVDSYILHVRFLPVVVRNEFSPHNPSLDIVRSAPLLVCRIRSNRPPKVHSSWPSKNTIKENKTDTVSRMEPKMKRT